MVVRETQALDGFAAPGSAEALNEGVLGVTVGLSAFGRFGRA